MAIEAKRFCGWRKVNALYLCGEYIPVPCDRMPVEIGACKVCGQGLHCTRSMTEIDPLRLWGIHQPCKDRPTCFMCYPPSSSTDYSHYVMFVGKKYYSTESFLDEATKMGISKRIPFVPKKLVLGTSVVYLAHPEAVEVRESPALQEALAIIAGPPEQTKLLEVETVKRVMGIFAAFRPQRVEMLVWEHELTDKKREELEKRGITPIPVPAGDLDHV